MMYVGIITDNNNPEPGMENTVTDIVGPFDTEAEAEAAVRDLFLRLNRIDDFSVVRDYEIKPIRTVEKSYDRNASELMMWARVYNRPFNPDRGGVW